MPILCTICGKEYQSHEKLQKHLSNTHEDQAKRKFSTCDTNGEFVETVHSSLRRYEETHGTKIVRKKGTPQHLIQSQRTLTGYNSRRAGFSPAYEMTIRKKNSPQSPLV